MAFMNRAEVIEKLKAIEPALRTRGVAALYLFGSFARDEGGPDSDIDVFVEPAHDEAYRFENFMGAHDILQQALGGRVDYGTRNGLSKYARAAIEEEAVRVF
jgi:predicted nucleotidyltransferase